jgi:hypothetical protein
MIKRVKPYVRVSRMRRYRMVDMCKGKKNNDFNALMMSLMWDCTWYGISKIHSQHHRILPRTSLDLHLTYHPSIYPCCLALDLSLFFFFSLFFFIFLSFLFFLFSSSFSYSLSLSLSLSLSFIMCTHTQIYIYIFLPHIFIFSSEAFCPSFFYKYQSEF